MNSVSKDYGSKIINAIFGIGCVIWFDGKPIFVGTLKPYWFVVGGFEWSISNYTKSLQIKLTEFCDVSEESANCMGFIL